MSFLPDKCQSSMDLVVSHPHMPMMRAMLLEDGSQSNPDAWDINKQYYYGDWFLVAPAGIARSAHKST